MAKFKVEEAVEMMKNLDLVRNLGIIAHIDHGKSTLSDSLLASSGLLSEEIAGMARATDTREDEQERGITIKTTGISLVHEFEGNTYVINLQDTPGHVDFSGEVTAALRVVDGALVVVDAVEGVMVQTETVTRQALMEYVRPVLMINKVDRLITEMKLPPEEAYERFKQIIRDFNILIDTYAPPKFKEKWRVDPREGTVAFGSAFHRFGVTVPMLAKVWAEKTGKDPKTLVKGLWQKKNFVQGVLNPLYQIYEAAFNKDVEFLKKVTKQIGVRMSEDDFLLNEKELAKKVLSQWMPVEVAVLDMVCKHLPSPKEAQQYRIHAIWEGDLESDVGKAMLHTDPNGPLMIVLSKMIPMRSKQIVAMGRIFSGTVHSGHKVKVLMPGYVPESNDKDRKFAANIQGVSVLMGKDTERVPELVAGNIVALHGLRGAVASATITDLDDVMPFKALSFAVEPVVRIALEPEKPSDLPKLADGLRLMQLVDPSLHTEINEETGEYIIAGTGELHIEIAVKDLQDLQNIKVRQSQPIVVFRESVEGKSEFPALAKSPNKHNRIWMIAEPLDENAIKLIEKGEVSQYMDRKQLARVFREHANWDTDEGRNVWAFGPTDNEPNVLIDSTKGVQYLREVRDYINQGFRWAAKEGPLAGEPFYGVKFKITDVSLHEDPVHRGAGQIMPTARRACFGSLLLAKPILLEPIYRVEVQVPETYLGGVYKVLTKRRGNILDTKRREGTPIQIVIGEVPVAESFGIVAELRSETSGSAFTQMIFSHWSKVPGDPMKPASEGGGLAREYVEQVRKRKGYPSVNPPKPEDYYDKL